MTWLPRLIVTTILAVCVALLLSLLPKMENGSPVFHSVKAEPVSDANIVDLVSKMQLHLRIRKVELNHAIVSIDLLATPASGRNEIVQDVYEIARAFFSRSTNINQVLVRVMDSSNSSSQGSTTLLLATDARREKWLPGETVILSQSAEEMEQYLQFHSRVTYTPIWQERFDIKS